MAADDRFGLRAQRQEIDEVRRLAREVREKFPPERDAQGHVMPWDIEFGFAKGELGLFQIRPLSRYREARTLEALASIESGGPAPEAVALDARIAGP